MKQARAVARKVRRPSPDCRPSLRHRGVGPRGQKSPSLLRGEVWLVRTVAASPAGARHGRAAGWRGRSGAGRGVVVRDHAAGGGVIDQFEGVELRARCGPVDPAWTCRRGGPVPRNDSIPMVKGQESRLGQEAKQAEAQVVTAVERVPAAAVRGACEPRANAPANATEHAGGGRIID